MGNPVTFTVRLLTRPALRFVCRSVGCDPDWATKIACGLQWPCCLRCKREIR